jgi:hypothetical protein
MIYLGFEYRPWEDCDEDCIKIFHECYRDGRRVEMPAEFYNHTPYKTMPYETFKEHVHQLEVWIQG